MAAPAPAPVGLAAVAGTRGGVVSVATGHFFGAGDAKCAAVLTRGAASGTAAGGACIELYTTTPLEALGGGAVPATAVRSLARFDVACTGAAAHLTAIPRSLPGPHPHQQHHNYVGDALGLVTDTGAFKVLLITVRAVRRASAQDFGDDDDVAPSAPDVSLETVAEGALVVDEQQPSKEIHQRLRVLPPVLLGNGPGRWVWAVPAPPREVYCVALEWRAGGGNGGGSVAFATYLRYLDQVDPFAAGVELPPQTSPIASLHPHITAVAAHAVRDCNDDPCLAVLVSQPLVPRDPFPQTHLHVYSLVGLGGAVVGDGGEASTNTTTTNNNNSNSNSNTVAPTLPAPRAAALKSAGWLVKNITPGTRVVHPLVVDDTAAVPTGPGRGGGYHRQPPPKPLSTIDSDADGVVILAGPERLELYSVKGLQCMTELSTTPKIQSLAALGVPVAVTKISQQNEHGMHDGGDLLNGSYRALGSAGSSRRGNSGGSSRHAGGGRLISATCEYALVTDRFMTVLFTVKRNLTIEAKPRRYYTIEISGAVPAAVGARGGDGRPAAWHCAPPGGVAFIPAPLAPGDEQPHVGGGRSQTPTSPTHAGLASNGLAIVHAEHAPTTVVEVNRGRLRAAATTLAPSTHSVVSITAPRAGRNDPAPSKILYTTAQGGLYRVGKSVVFRKAMDEPAPLVGYADLHPAVCGGGSTTAERGDAGAGTQYIVLAFNQGFTVLHMDTLSFLPPPEELEEATVVAVAGGCIRGVPGGGLIVACTDGVHILQEHEDLSTGELGFKVAHRVRCGVEMAAAASTRGMAGVEGNTMATACRDGITLWDFTEVHPTPAGDSAEAASSHRVFEVRVSGGSGSTAAAAGGAGGDVSALALANDIVYYGTWGCEALLAIPDERRTAGARLTAASAGLKVALPGTPRKIVPSVEQGLIFTWCIGGSLVLVRAGPGGDPGSGRSNGGDDAAAMTIVASLPLANTARMNLTLLRGGLRVWCGGGVVEAVPQQQQQQLYTLEFHPATTAADNACVVAGEVVWTAPTLGSASGERDMWIGDIETVDWHVQELAASPDITRRLVARLRSDVFVTAEASDGGSISVTVWAEGAGAGATSRAATPAQSLTLPDFHPAELLGLAADATTGRDVHVTASSNGHVYYFQFGIDVHDMAAATPAVGISARAAKRLGVDGGGLALLTTPVIDGAGGAGAAAVPATSLTTPAGTAARRPEDFLMGVSMLAGDTCGLALPGASNAAADADADADATAATTWGVVHVRASASSPTDHAYTFSELSGPAVGMAASGKYLMCAIALSGVDVLVAAPENTARYTRLYHCRPALVTRGVAVSSRTGGSGMVVSTLGGDTPGAGASLMALHIAEGSPPSPDDVVCPVHTCARPVANHKTTCHVDVRVLCTRMSCAPAALVGVGDGRVMVGGRHGLTFVDA